MNLLPYQKCQVSLPEVANSLLLPESGKIPQIILSVSPCRSGTTVMLRVMAVMGAESYFQPLKNLLRWQLQLENRPWSLPIGREKTVYLKETLGPYTQAEAAFNPLELLLLAGVPPSNLHVWIYGRTPLDCYASWRKWWGENTSLDLFVTSYHTVHQIRQQALEAEISTTTLTYELFATCPASTVMYSLAHRFGLIFSPQAIENWQNLPHFGSDASKIIQPEEPPVFITTGIHDQVETATEFSYRPTSSQSLSLITDTEQAQMRSAGLFEIYNQWYQASLADLQMPEQLPE